MRVARARHAVRPGAGHPARHRAAFRPRGHRRPRRRRRRLDRAPRSGPEPRRSIERVPPRRAPADSAARVALSRVTDASGPSVARSRPVGADDPRVACESEPPRRGPGAARRPACSGSRASSPSDFSLNATPEVLTAGRGVVALTDDIRGKPILRVAQATDDRRFGPAPDRRARSPRRLARPRARAGAGRCDGRPRAALRAGRRDRLAAPHPGHVTVGARGFSRGSPRVARVALRA